MLNFKGILLCSTAIFMSACTQQSFQAFQTANADAVPKTPGYLDPNAQKYAMPDSEQPLVSSHFNWKKSYDKTAKAPDAS